MTPKLIPSSESLMTIPSVRALEEHRKDKTRENTGELTKMNDKNEGDVENMRIPFPDLQEDHVLERVSSAEPGFSRTA
ncbi:hypothetical protein TREES_T100010064 [Tupaia chinensis]|uniref:Uncharacterized protein n=1 Tax=Tupaia chinensis TaxID=246437 RepID=L9KE48_TUPCH|nr:hypothetical protein TREES_T100010064 [Tupaia chinensis]